jgi:hypothetical protein
MTTTLLKKITLLKENYQLDLVACFTMTLPTEKAKQQHKGSVYKKVHAVVSQALVGEEWCHSH